MSELKAFDIVVAEEGYFEGIVKYRRAVYDKSEADKVIADLEESHKMEVEQLLMEIVELKADYREACGRLQTANIIKDEQLAATRRHKYKRCLAMAWWCSAELGDLVSTWEFKIKHYKKWQRRWLELAKKFKDSKH